jgi:arsenite methyltransferase
MPDVYATITELAPAVVEQVAVAMELSATDPQHQEMVANYLSDLELPERARALEIGCGTGAISRIIARCPGVETVVGVDPSPVLIAKAREIARDVTNVSFEKGDGSDLPVESASFDAVVVHRVLSHVPGPERVLAEAFRVVRPGGWLALFDGDYATITVATGAEDPVQACVAAFASDYINDPWVVRPFLANGR